MEHAAPTGWTVADNALTRTWDCGDFVDSLAFVLEIAREAEQLDHHPGIDIRSSKVHLSLCTHSAGHRLTEKDFYLAEKINRLDPAVVRLTRDELHKRFQT